MTPLLFFQERPKDDNGRSSGKMTGSSFHPKKTHERKEQRINSTGNKMKRIQGKRTFPQSVDQEFPVEDDNQESNEGTSMPFSSPEDTQREIEELELRAQALRQLLQSLEDHPSKNVKKTKRRSPSKKVIPEKSDKKSLAKKLRTHDEVTTDLLNQLVNIGSQRLIKNSLDSLDIPLPDTAKEEVLIYSTRVREEDEDSLDRELMRGEDFVSKQLKDKADVGYIDDQP